MNYSLQIILIIFLIYSFVLVFLYFYQRNLLYHPNENNYSDDKITVNIEKVNIKTSDNINLLGWYHEKNLKEFKTLIFFHGNAGSLENRIHKLNHFKDMNVNFLIIAWRGFSGNSGEPSENGLYKDGKSAIDWLIKKDISEQKLILYGESLGTGVATELASKNKFAGVILESPFTSIADSAKIYYPYLPVNLLLKDRYDSKNKIKKINSPILIMHGKKDNIVPQKMGLELFENANNPKFSYFPDDDDHMMEYNDELLFNIKNFIIKL